MTTTDAKLAWAWQLRCLLLNLFLYCASFALLPIPEVSVGLVVGLVLAACQARRHVALLVWLLGNALGPPQWFVFSQSYNESHYLFFQQSNWLFSAIFFAVSYLGGTALAWTTSTRRLLGLVVMVTMTVMYPFKVGLITPNFPGILDQPPAPGYQFDGIQQLKAFHLYQQGKSYYQASLVSFAEDGRNFPPGFPGLSTRSPLLFWLLTPVPSPSAVAWVAWSLSMLCALAIYWGSCRLADPLLSLSAPALFLASYVYVQSNYWLFIQDPWATQFAILGVAALVLWPRLPLAALAFSLAFAVREFQCSLLVAFCAMTFRRHPKQALLGSLGLLLCMLLYHYNRNQSQLVIGMEAIPLASRLHFSPAFAALTMRFGSVLVLGRDLIMPLLFFFSCLAPLLNPRLPVLLLSGQSLFLVIAFCFLGNGGAYYSYNVMPLMVWAAVLGLASQEWPGAIQKARRRESKPTA